MNNNISIVIPIYNSESDLNNCINSVINQTSNGLECILVDDGSIDKSCEICDLYSNLDIRFTSIHKKNKGVSNSRNIGIEHSNSEYLIFVDSDDEIERNTIEFLQEAVFNNNKNDVFIYGYKIIDKNKEECKMPEYGQFLKKDFSHNYINLYLKFLINPPWNKVFLKSHLENIRFDEDISLGEDLLFFNEYLRNVNNICLINKALYIHQQKSCGTLTTKHYRNLFELYKKHFNDVENTINSFGNCDFEDESYKLILEIYKKYIIDAINRTINISNELDLKQKIRRIRSILNDDVTTKCFENNNKNLLSYLISDKNVFGLFFYNFSSKFKKKIRHILGKIEYELSVIIEGYLLRRNNYLEILDDENTILKIINEKLSVSRFGDGELSIILDNANIGFQEYDRKLSKELEKVLKSDNDRLLVCLPLPINSTKGLNKKAKKFWTVWCIGKNRKKRIENLLLENNKTSKIKNKVYGNTQITRPYMDNSKLHATNIFKKLKKIWENRKLLIVEGSKTKLGVGNDLFNNSESIQRIICPSQNCYKVYDEILNSIIKYYEGQLVLIALGPTATVLAKDLTDYGIQAIDIGHIDIEYEWYLSDSKEKKPVDGKYVNECNDSNYVFFNDNDYNYNAQIIHNIEDDLKK